MLKIGEIFLLILLLLCVCTCACGKVEHRYNRGFLSSLKSTIPMSNAAVARVVRKLNSNVEKQNAAIDSLANVTHELVGKTDANNILKSCILTEKYGYTRIQLETASKPFDVFCEQILNEGGWTLVLQRFNGTSHTAQDFRHGYNSVEAGEYFIGTDRLYALTNSRVHELIFVLEFANLSTYTMQSPSFVLRNPEAYELWAEEHDTRRHSWAHWQTEAAQVAKDHLWGRYESCKDKICGLESFIIFLLKWNFVESSSNPLLPHMPIRLYKLLVRPANPYWTVPV